MEGRVCTWGCGVCARCWIDAAVEAGAGEVRPWGRHLVRNTVVEPARRAALAGRTLAALARDLGKSEAAVVRALQRAHEHEVLSQLRPPPPPRRGGRWLAPPSGDGLDAWRAARARRAAFLAAATRPARPVLPVVEEPPGGTVMSDALLAELAAREQARARKAAGL